MGALFNVIKESALMSWVFFAIGAALSWGLYGPTLHKGQVMLGKPAQGAALRRRRLLPDRGPRPGRRARRAGRSARLQHQRQPRRHRRRRRSARSAPSSSSTPSASGGLPAYVMPLVFGGAPLVNVLVSMAMHPPKESPNPLLWVGYLLASAGAGWCCTSSRKSAVLSAGVRLKRTRTGGCLLR